MVETKIPKNGLHQVAHQEQDKIGEKETLPNLFMNEVSFDYSSFHKF